MPSLLRAFLWLVPCLLSSPATGWSQPSTPDPVLVAVLDLASGPRDIVLPERVGWLAADESHVVAFVVPGRLVQIGELGQTVRRSELVARMDDALDQARLQQAEIGVREAARELERVRALRRSQVASAVAVEKAEDALALRRAERDAIGAQLAQRRLLAPWDGVIVDPRFESGEVVGAGVPVATLLRVETLELVVGVPGARIGEVAEGQRARVRVSAHPHHAFAGTVRRIAPAAAPGQPLFDVEIEVPNPEGRLRPGMTARTEIVLRTLPHARAVPVESMVDRAGVRVVYFVRDGRAREVDVSRAHAQRDHLLVTGPLPSRRVVVRGQRALTDGTPVRVDNRVLRDVAEPVREADL